MRNLLLVILVALSFVSLRAEARRISRWYGPAFSHPAWRGGYWYHGGWGPRVGWWWVVGPTWYYYAAPIYPYPSPDVAPAYYAQVGSAPPPAPMAAGAVPGTAPMAPTAVAPNSASKSQAFSYFCKATNSYYPVVGTCEGGWVASPVKGPN